MNQKTAFITRVTSGIGKVTAQLFAIKKTGFYIVLAIKIVPTSVAVPMVTLQVKPDQNHHNRHFQPLRYTLLPVSRA